MRSAFLKEKALSWDWDYEFSLVLMQLKRVFQKQDPNWALIKDLKSVQN